LAWSLKGWSDYGCAKRTIVAGGDLGYRERHNGDID